MLFYDPAKADPKFCRNIRTKMSYVPSSSQEHVAELSSSAQHWCVLTQGVCGPDGGFVQPSECGNGRDCFESIESE
jgi:hypothetical protein